MHARAKISLSVIIAFAVIAAWIYLSAGKTTAEAPDYSLTGISRGAISTLVSATGTLSPVITVQVGSQVSGAIQQLYADFNRRVKKGEVIARIDPALFQARVAEAEANVKSAEAARDKAWVGVLDAKRQLDRLEELRAKNLVAESEVDAARFAHEAAQVEHKVKEASISQAAAARDREQVNLAYTTIYAPIDGVVISRDVDVGQTVAASLQAPTLFTIAQDLAQMKIETDVDEAFIGMIEEQQPVSFTVFAYPQRKFAGKVSQVRLQPKVEAGVVKYNCIIYVANGDLALKPGMTATVAIVVAARDDVLKVANTALRFVPQRPAEELKKLGASLGHNEAILWVARNGGIEPVKVSVGIAGEKESEISGAGIEAGMKVAVPATAKESTRRRMSLSLF
jgi:HlyD family secretion protein